MRPVDDQSPFGSPRAATEGLGGVDGDGDSITATGDAMTLGLGDGDSIGRRVAEAPVGDGDGADAEQPASTTAMTGAPSRVM